MARLHESVVDLKMKLATAQAKFQTNKGNIENGGNENSSIEESIKLQEALNDRVKALSHDLLKAEAKNRKLRRLLENSKKDGSRKLANEQQKQKQQKRNAKRLDAMHLLALEMVVQEAARYRKALTMKIAKL